MCSNSQRMVPSNPMMSPFIPPTLMTPYDHPMGHHSHLWPKIAKKQQNQEIWGLRQLLSKLLLLCKIVGFPKSQPTPSLHNWWIPMTSVRVPGGSSHSYINGVHVFILLSIIFNCLKNHSSLQYHRRRSCKISSDANFQNLNLLFLQIKIGPFLSEIWSKTRDFLNMHNGR